MTGRRGRSKERTRMTLRKRVPDLSLLVSTQDEPQR